MIQTKYMTQNRTYTRPVKIQPEYVIVHSVGTAGKPTKDRLWDSWNKASASKSAHGMVDAEGCWQTLPLDVKGWHVGSRRNGQTVGFEICEPGNIAYADAAHTKVDTEKYNPQNPDVRTDFMKRYANAVEMAAHMCRETGIPVSRVLCHQEAARKGIASNHADVLHWFPLFGKSMDTFRQDVARALGTGNYTPETQDKPQGQINGSEGMPYVVRVTANVLNVRGGPGTGYPVRGTVKRGEAYTIVEVRGGWGRLKSGAGWIALEYTQKK